MQGMHLRGKKQVILGSVKYFWVCQNGTILIWKFIFKPINRKIPGTKIITNIQKNLSQSLKKVFSVLFIIVYWSFQEHTFSHL
jgi:hypothetical protein